MKLIKEFLCKSQIFDDEEDCSFAPADENDSYEDLLTNKSKLQYYKNKAAVKEIRKKEISLKKLFSFTNNNSINVKKRLFISEKPFIPWKNESNNCKFAFLFLRITKNSSFRKCAENRQLGNASHQHESYPSTSNNNTDHRVNDISLEKRRIFNITFEHRSVKTLFHFSSFLRMRISSLCLVHP